MSSPPAGSTSGETPYIRARSGGEVNGRKVLRFVTALCVLALAGITIATAFGAAHQNSSQTRLQREGVPVTVTVTECKAYGSGIGQTVTFYDCRGTYTLDGRHYNELIDGTRSLHPAGQTLKAFTVPGDPALLSTAAAVDKKFSRWTPYITPIILAVVTVALALGLVLWPRRSRSRQPAVTSATVG